MSAPRPRGVTPHLFVSDAQAAVSFYRSAFGADEIFSNQLPDGRVLFVELAIGAGRLLVSEENRALNALTPDSIGGTPSLLLLEVDEVDAAAERAVGLGAEIEMPVAEMFWGERYGLVRDPFGHRWALSTARQQLTPDEIVTRSPTDV